MNNEICSNIGKTYTTVFHKHIATVYLNVGLGLFHYYFGIKIIKVAGV